MWRRALITSAPPLGQGNKQQHFRENALSRDPGQIPQNVGAKRACPPLLRTLGNILSSQLHFQHTHVV
jgi:hypothetical protein